MSVPEDKLYITILSGFAQGRAIVGAAIDEVREEPFRYTCPDWRTSMKLLLTLLMAVTAYAETHQFAPTKFYNTFSGAHPPVLHIKPGDHVITSTIDARGFDSAGVQRGQRPNPETGPFYIDGAEPGDTLVVHLLRLETNRATGFSASLLAPYTAIPSFCGAKRCAKQSRRPGISISKKGLRIAIRRISRDHVSSCRCGRCWAALVRPRTITPPSHRVPPTTLAATWTTTAWARALP